MQKVKTEVSALPIMEHFYTIQGEGFHSGKAAYFIRVAGCDVGCVWCDVKDSWHTEGYPVMDSKSLAKAALEHPSKLIVLTGGEPTMYDLNDLTSHLKESGFTINMETSGTHPLTGDIDWVCFSPKKFKKPLPEIYKVADELKVIIFHKSDFDFAEEHAALVKPGCKLYLQVEWSKREQMMPLVVEYVKQNPQWEISVQTHKYMNIP